MLPLATAVSWIAGAVLVSAGWGKLRDPAPTRRAVRSLIRDVPDAAVRVLGAAEIAVAAAVALVAGPWPLVALAVLYGGFAAVAARLRRQGSACGCLGDTGAPTTRAHVLADATATLGALVAATAPTSPPVRWLAEEGALTAGAGLAGLFAAAWLVHLLSTAGRTLRTVEEPA